MVRSGRNGNLAYGEAVASHPEKQDQKDLSHSPAQNSRSPKHPWHSSKQALESRNIGWHRPYPPMYAST